jgi:CBS domain-containing protein
MAVRAGAARRGDARIESSRRPSLPAVVAMLPAMLEHDRRQAGWSIGQTAWHLGRPTGPQEAQGPVSGSRADTAAEPPLWPRACCSARGFAASCFGKDLASDAKEELMGQQVKDVMTAGPVVLGKDAPLMEAARLMRDKGIGDVIVVEGESAEGIVTDRDLVIRGVAEGADPSTTRLGQIISSELVAVAPDDPVERAIKLMRERAVRRLPVVEGGKPVGIVSIGDLAVERDADSVLADISKEPPNR